MSCVHSVRVDVCCLLNAYQNLEMMLYCRLAPFLLTFFIILRLRTLYSIKSYSSASWQGCGSGLMSGVLGMMQMIRPYPSPSMRKIGNCIG